MGIDPLAVSTLGFFTARSDNVNPLTLSHLGYILFGGTKHGRGWDYKKKRKHDRFLRKQREKYRKQMLREIFGEEVEIKEELEAIGIPVGLGAKPLSEIPDEVEREIAKLMREKLILEHAEELKERIEDDAKFEEEFMFLMMMMLDE